MAPRGSIGIVCGLALIRLAAVEAWLPSSVTVRLAGRANARSRKAGFGRNPPLLSIPLETVEGASDSVRRPDLLKMREGFERSMDGRLVMDYVKELRERKALLLTRLEETGGIITEDIFPIMEELALVNPSSGCGTGSDRGKDHYSAMLLGHWIAASTIVPTVPYVYGDGEPIPSTTTKAPASLPSNGSGPTCTLGQLALAVSGKECRGDFDPSAAVRPLRVRLSALANTVAKGQMPTVVVVAGFAHAWQASQAAAVPESEAAGAVRARGKWAVAGGNHLRWEFETMSVDAGGEDRIAKAEAVEARVGGEGEEGGSWGARDLHEFFLDQNMLILAWKGDSPGSEDAVVFVRDELPRRY